MDPRSQNDHYSAGQRGNYQSKADVERLKALIVPPALQDRTTITDRGMPPGIQLITWLSVGW